MGQQSGGGRMNLPLQNMNNVTLFFGGECFLDPSLSRMEAFKLLCTGWISHVEHYCPKLDTPNLPLV
jgi:hypothetical protein